MTDGYDDDDDDKKDEAKQELVPCGDPRKQLAILSKRVPGWIRRLPPPWGPVPEEWWDDVAQEVLAKAAEALPRYDPEKPMAPWLYKITQRTARDIREREQFRGSFSAHEDVASVGGRGNPEVDMATAQYVRLVNETLGEMEESLRAVLEAIELAELTHDEAAELLGISKRTVKDRLERAREDFSKRIKRKMGDRGLAVLPFAFEGLFAFIRARTEHASEEQLARLRAIAERAPAAEEEARVADGRPAVPEGEPPISAPASFAGGNITGGILGGIVVYLLMRPTPAPEVITGRIRVPGPIVATESVMATIPTATTKATAAAASVDAVDRGARALLDRGLRSLEAGDIAAARSALARYEERFPGNPLPQVRDAVIVQIGLAERNRRSP